MRSKRLLVVAVLAVITFGTLALNGGYAWYLRSDRYRRSCAAALSDELVLPADIGRVVPRSRDSREFLDVRIWLPHRRDEAAFCRSAVLTRTPTPEAPEACELDLKSGCCEISTRTWLREDYRFMLESGLRPGFDPNGPRRVVFRGMDLTFERDRFRASLNDASGVVDFADPHLGRATITCTELNGYSTADPATLHAEFSPQPFGIQLDRIELIVPELPIEVLDLHNLADLPIHSGSFTGRLVYREIGDDRELSVAGKTFDVPLAECTAAFLENPWRGKAREIELEELSLANDMLQRVRFRGVLTDAILGDMLAPWGLAEAGGDLTLHVQAANVSPIGIERLVAAGRCTGIDLNHLSDALGMGHMSGQARIIIDDLTIKQNRLEALDIVIAVEPPADGTNWIERELVSEVLRRTIGIPLPSFLPERFEYTQLGVRLQVRDEELYVFGTHGPHEKTILSVNIAGREFAAVVEPEKPIDLSGPLEQLRAQLAAHIAERWQTLTPRQAWEIISLPLQQRATTRSSPPQTPEPE